MTLPALLPLHWLRPWWLCALLALPLLAWWWRRHQRAGGAWDALVDAHLLPALLASPARRHPRVAHGLALLALALAVCALAGPSWQRDEQPLWQQRAPLVIALDLSSATLAADLPPSRLVQARASIGGLLHARAGGQAGLVAYADDAFTVAPLTDDAANVALLLDALAPDIMPADGSNTARAIGWSARLLKQAGFTQGDILLLTDHAGEGARDAAREAANAGYRVSVLGLGTPQGAAYRDARGTIASARLDAPSLRALAAAGGGRYAALSADAAGLAGLDLLDPQRGGSVAAHGARTLLWRDQGYWLLLPALLCAVFAFRRGGVLATLLLCAVLPWQPAHAANGWWLRPDQQAHARMEQGVDAYQRGDYRKALQAWQGLPGADAAYNRGNALAKTGAYREAIAAYEQALAMQPGMQDAIANREAVRRAMQRQHDQHGRQQSQRQQKQEGQDQAGKDQGAQKQPGKQGQQAPQPGREDASRQTRQQSGDARSQPRGTDPADADAQRKADAAQRERMREALQRQPAPAAQQPQRRAETPAQRERRLANEAWLRRIPDDPGGLLREKFRLEQQRRQEEGR